MIAPHSFRAIPKKTGVLLNGLLEQRLFSLLVPCVGVENPVYVVVRRENDLNLRALRVSDREEGFELFKIASTEEG